VPLPTGNTDTSLGADANAICGLTTGVDPDLQTGTYPGAVNVPVTPTH
jgi:hypothetical protein